MHVPTFIGQRIGTRKILPIAIVLCRQTPPRLFIVALCLEREIRAIRDPFLILDQERARLAPIARSEISYARGQVDCKS